MAIIKWRPFDEFERFFEDEFIPFLPMRRFSAPASDVYETENEVVVEMPLAGIDPEKVEISVENDILNVSGSFEETDEEKKRNYFRKEVRRGSFGRTISLPKPVKGEEANAEYEKGILTITIPKEERAKPKKISVQVKK